jgi:hypothetical protein
VEEKLEKISIFLPLDPDPNCEFGSGSRDPIESGFNPDPHTDFN